MKVFTNLCIAVAIFLFYYPEAHAEIYDCNVVLFSSKSKRVDGNSDRIKNPEAKDFFNFSIDSSVDDRYLPFATTARCIRSQQFKKGLFKGKICIRMAAGRKPFAWFAPASDTDSYYDDSTDVIGVGVYTTSATDGDFPMLDQAFPNSSAEISLPVKEFRTISGRLFETIRMLTLTCKVRS